MQNILLVHTRGGMGDLLLSSVLAEALRRCLPGCRVTLWPRPEYACLFDGHPFVDDCLRLDPEASLLSNVGPLRACGFDAAILSWSVSRLAWLVRFAGIPVRVGRSDRLTYSFLYTHRVRLRSRQGDTASHWPDVQLDYARAIGCPAPPDLQPIVALTPAEAAQAAGFLRSVGVAGQRPVCGLHVCKGLAVNEARWPLGRFADIAAGMLQRGFDVVLTGTESERPLTARVAEQAAAQTSGSPGRLVDLAGRLSLRQTAAVLQQLHVYICPDTGTGHLAAAVGVPVVSIFPLRSDFPDRWRPAIAAHRIVRPDGWECSGPCVKEKCPRFTCLLHIDAGRVVDAATAIARPERKDTDPCLK